MSHRVLVAGGGGFIGGHLVGALLERDASVRAVDVKRLNEWHQLHRAAENVQADLSHREACRSTANGVDHVYNVASDMGGMGFIDGNKAACMLSVLISTNLLLAARDQNVERFFFASSACVYAADKQNRPQVRGLRESDAYPAMPEDGYGWEKLFSERMCRHFHEDFDLATRVARYHNVYGPFGTWAGGREKAPAALCRKIAVAKLSGNSEIEVWGDGMQTRSFTYVDDCVRGTLMLTDSDVTDPMNIGSSELVSINDLVEIISEVSGVEVTPRYRLDAPQGVRGRNSDNTFIRERLGWEPSTTLRDGMRHTFEWVLHQVEQARRA